MKGLLNNEQAVNISNKLLGNIDHRLHEIYNLGYKQGYEDGHYDCIQSLTEQILAERKNDEATVRVLADK